VVLDGAHIVAVGRFDRLPGTDDAEVAFVVADERLLHRARAEGITRFVAEMLSENHRMRQVFGRSGLLAGSATEAGVVHVVLDLGPEHTAPDERVRSVPRQVTFGPAAEHRAASCCKPMEVDRNGLEVLSREDCLYLLASATLGRIAFTSGALPRVLPVSFHLERERILVRTARGSQLDVALQDVVVAFEVDDFDPIHHSGWSVAVTGVAAEVSDPTELDSARQVPVAHWAAAGDEVVIAISTELVSGRRTTTGSLATQLGPRLTRTR